MNLSSKIANRIDGRDPVEKVILLEEWKREALRLEYLSDYNYAASRELGELSARMARDAKDAWRSFYVASVVVGLLLSTVIWQHFMYRPQCGASRLIGHPEVLRLAPSEVRVSRGEVTEL